MLCDLNTPGMGGLEVLTRLREYWREIPFTARCLIQEAVTAIKQGARRFILKPLNVDDLEISIRHAVEHVEIRAERFRGITGSVDVRQFQPNRRLVFDGGGIHTRTDGIARDIAERVKLEGELDACRGDLESKVERLALRWTLLSKDRFFCQRTTRSLPLPPPSERYHM